MMSFADDSFVRINRITKRYGNHLAVDDLSLNIKKGEFLSLLGPSGCGKTTTLRMIAGFEEPDSGEIEIEGVSVIGVPPYKRNVNTVFQAYALFPHMTVAENVAYGLQQKRVKKTVIKEKVSNVLEMVQMRSFADRKPTMLSGGQQQRVALARALINQPSVLLLDEPLAALDRKLREEMQLELKLIQAKLGLTFVFVTHDQGEALSMSDRIAVMKKGRIEQLGDSDTIYSKPQSAFVASFVGQQNFFDGTVNSAATAVTTPYGLISPAEPITRVKPAEKARAAVRPEFIRVHSAQNSSNNIAAGATVNTVPGKIIGVSHLGETRQFLVQLSAEFSIISRIPTHEAPHLVMNEQVYCSWNASHVQVFADEESVETLMPTTTAIKTA